MPKNLRFENKQPTGFRVVFDKPEGNPEIKYFTIEIKSKIHQQKVNIDAGGWKHFADFYNLPRDTVFDVEVCSCLAELGGCSIPLEGKVKTPRTWFCALVIF